MNLELIFFAFPLNIVHVKYFLPSQTDKLCQLPFNLSPKHKS